MTKACEIRASFAWKKGESKFLFPMQYSKFRFWSMFIYLIYSSINYGQLKQSWRRKSHHRKIIKSGVVLLLSNRPRNIRVPSTCSFGLCFRALPTIQTRDKENISEQELQLGWASLLVHLGELGKAE